MEYLTNKFHLAVRVYSDNARMTSKRGKNKEVVWMMFLPRFDVSVRYQSTHARPNGIYWFYTLFQYRPSRQNYKCFLKIFVVMVCARKPLRLISSFLRLYFIHTTLDQSIQSFYSIQCVWRILHSGAKI